MTNQHYEKYKDTIKACSKKYNREHPEKTREHQRRYYNENPEFRLRKIEQMRAYRKRKKEEEEAAGPKK